jgi:hypothetical protein
MSGQRQPRAPDRSDSETRSAVDELTVTLWCLATLLAVLLASYWFTGTIYA